MPKCTICPKSELSSISALWLHLQVVHCAAKSDTFRCNEIDCHRVFNSWALFRKHLQSFHLFQPKINQQRTNLIGCNVSSKDISEIKSDFLPEGPEQPMEVDNIDLSSTIFNLILVFILQLYSNHKLARSHVQEVLINAQHLFTVMIASLKSKIVLKLRDYNVSESAIKEIESLLGSVLEPFKLFCTEYRRLKLLQNHGCLVPFQSYAVGARTENKMVQGSIVKDTVAVEAQFFQMRLVLQKIFSLPDVLKSVKDYMLSLYNETEIIENFIQGKLWKNKVRERFEDKFVIPLFVYFDDFEINNPLGSHSGIQKLGALYYSIPCLPPEFNSLLDNNFLAGLFHSSDRITFTNHKIFHKIIDELNFLQSDGITIDGSTEKIYFSLGLILGDNLGLNSIFGFVESFSAHYFCRLCKVSKAEVPFSITEQKLRFETYESDVLPNNVQLTGIKEQSVWDNIKHFRTVHNFVVDWLHDGPEGWGKEIVTLVLHFLCKILEPEELRISINVLNGRMRSFDYHRNAISNPPPGITFDEIEKKSLKMSGSEMQNFILVLPMIIGDLVSVDCEEWKLFTLFRQIMDIVMCRRLQPGYSTLLKTLVSESIILFRQVFPSETIKPKTHNFTHYGSFRKIWAINQSFNSKF